MTGGLFAAGDVRRLNGRPGHAVPCPRTSGEAACGFIVGAARVPVADIGDEEIEEPLSRLAYIRHDEPKDHRQRAVRLEQW